MTNNQPRLRRFRLQFSLASVFVLMTLCAIGTWYWYQRPFAVEHNIVLPADDPFADTPPWSRREVEYVRRVWGGKTRRHGPRREYDNKGTLLSLESYRNGQKHGEFVNYNSLTAAKTSLQAFVRGQRHGPSQLWNARGDLILDEAYYYGVRHGHHDARHSDGTPAIDAHFNRGIPIRKWSWFPIAQNSSGNKATGSIIGHWRDGVPEGHWEWFDAAGQMYLSAKFSDGRIANSDTGDLSPRMLEALIMATGETPQILLRAFTPVDLEFRETTVRGIASFMVDQVSLPIVINLPRLESAHVTLDSRITFHEENTPFLFALGKMLAPLGLGCEYRYGVFFIDTADTIGNWEDTTGVSQLIPRRGSHLAGEWNRFTTLDLEIYARPLKDVTLYLQEVHHVRFDLSLLPLVQKPNANVATPNSLVASDLRGLSFQNCLAMLLDQLHCKASLRGETIVIEPQ
ncbi:MAG TPA: hypothetical protein VGI40_05585 [Pirellulaceae bacterium]|jgi:hypothetical protein